MLKEWLVIYDIFTMNYASISSILSSQFEDKFLKPLSSSLNNIVSIIQTSKHMGVVKTMNESLYTICLLLNKSSEEFCEYRNIAKDKITKFISIDVKNEYFLNYEDFFKAFLYVNQQFGSTISNVMQKSDLIMINDIHLLLVPNCLLQKNTNAKVGIYFHSTFPSSDVLKTFPYHQEILKSILLFTIADIGR